MALNIPECQISSTHFPTLTLLLTYLLSCVGSFAPPSPLLYKMTTQSLN